MPDSSILSNPNFHLALAALFGGGLLVIFRGVLATLTARSWQKKVNERLQLFGRRELGEGWLRYFINLGERTLAATPPGQRLLRTLEACDLQWTLLLTVGIWLVLYGAVAIALFMLLGLGLFVNLLLSVIGATGVLAYFFLTRRDAYEKALQAQTPDIAQLISNSLRAGQSIYYSLVEVEEKLPRPANIEFRHLRQQIDLGEPLDQALRNFLSKHPGEEMRILITSLLVQRRAGGDLVKTLATISTAIRARRRLRAEIDTITAEARQTSLIVLIMPFFVLVIINRVQSGMVTQFISTPVGFVFFIVVYILPQVAAFLLIRKVGDVKV